MFQMSKKALLALAAEEGMVIVDGVDAAIIGLSHRCGESTVVAYDIERMIKVLMDRDSCGYWEAYEYIEYNCLGAYVGEMNPVYLRLVEDIPVRELSD